MDTPTLASQARAEKCSTLVQTLSSEDIEEFAQKANTKNTVLKVAQASVRKEIEVDR